MKFLKAVLGTSLLLGCTMSLPAQEEQKEKTLIQGVVLDSISVKPIAFASISVVAPKEGTRQHPDTLNQVTDDQGQFSITVPTATQYRLIASYVGKRPIPKTYHPQKEGPIVKVYMSDDEQLLDAVTVTAARSLVRIDADKIAYNVQDDPMSKTESLSELLSRVPLVTVDGQGNVQVKGSSNYKIYINGKPSKMVSSNPKDILRNIPASSIKNIEIITEPGVKYDAEGTAAILNIVTMGTTLEGYSGSIGIGNLSPHPLAITPNIFLMGKIGKFGFSGNYTGWFSRLLDSEFDTQHTVENFIQTEDKSKSSERRVRGHFGNISLSYEIDSLNLISADIGLYLQNLQEEQNSLNKEFLLKSTDSFTPSALIRRTELVQNQRGSVSANIDYQHSTHTPGELLTLSYQFVHTPSANKSLLLMEHLDPRTYLTEQPALKTLQQNSSTNALMNEHTGQIDYTRPFGSIHQIETGLKYIHRFGTATPQFLKKEENGPWINGGLYRQETSISGSPMNYLQNIIGAYGSYRIRLGQFALKSGLRIEKGWYDVHFKSISSADFKHQFLDLVPEVSVSYNPSPVSQIKLSYGFGVSRPSIEQLNPYKFQSSPYSLSYGNPDLDNERRHNIQLSVNHYTPKAYTTLSLFTDMCNNAILQYSFLDKDNKRLKHSTFGNIASRTTYGINFFGNYTPLSWLRLYTNLTTGYNLFRADAKTNIQGRAFNQTNKGFNGMAYIGSLLTLPKDWTISLNGGVTFSPPTINQSGSVYDWHNINISKALLKKKLRISLFATNPFHPYYTTTIKSFGEGFNTTVKIHTQSFNVGIGFSYSFGEMKSEIRKAERKINNDDLMMKKIQAPSNN